MAAHSERVERLIAAWKAAWEHGAFEEMDAILSPDYVRQGRASLPGQTREQFKAAIAAQRRAFDDLTISIDDAIEDGERLALRWHTSGTHMGHFLGVPPTGRRVTLAGASFAWFDGDAVMGEWVTFDRRDLLTSLGMPLGVATADTGRNPGATSVEDAVDPEALKATHSKFVTGVTVVTTQHDGVPKGLAVNAFSSISLTPPLVLVCIQKSSSTYEALVQAHHFAVNMLAADQLSIAQTFAAKRDDKFSAVPWRSGPHGSPLIDGACAHMEVEVGERLQASTHTVFIGRVVDAAHNDKAPLVYSARRFYDGGRLVPAEVTDTLVVG